MNKIELQLVTEDFCPPGPVLKQWVKTTLAQQKKQGSLVLRLVNEDEITRLNDQFRHKPKPTNVLSFPCAIPPQLRKDWLGDIVICAQVVDKEAQEQQKTLLAHWAHMVVHGVLHLLGHDHENEQDASIMEQAEIAILQDLGFLNPYQAEHSDE